MDFTILTLTILIGENISLHTELCEIDWQERDDKLCNTKIIANTSNFKVQLGYLSSSLLKQCYTCIGSLSTLFSANIHVCMVTNYPKEDNTLLHVILLELICYIHTIVCMFAKNGGGKSPYIIYTLLSLDFEAQVNSFLEADCNHTVPCSGTAQ